MTFDSLLTKGIEFFPDGKSLSLQDIKSIELMIQAPLPEQYRDYLLISNGGAFDKHITNNEYDDLYCLKVFWPKGNKVFSDEEYILFNNLFRFNTNDEPSTETLQYNFSTWKQYLPKDTLPIGRDPGGAYFLIGYGPENNGKIFYWRIVYVNIMELDEDDDTVAKAYCGFIANSFVEFIQAMVPTDTLQ